MLQDNVVANDIDRNPLQVRTLAGAGETSAGFWLEHRPVRRTN
jgi:hypothetical protein